MSTASDAPTWYHPLYTVYRSMLQRCFNKSHKAFKDYGGRGIYVCDRWLVGTPKGRGFRNFLSDMGPRPEKYTIERKDNSGPYSPENCIWATRKDQYRNRRGNVWIEFQGVRMIAKDWSAQTGIRSDVITRRIAKGVPLNIALFEKNLHPRDATFMISAAAAKKRAQTHCKRGHPLSGENLHLYGTIRICKTCKREAMRKRRSA